MGYEHMAGSLTMHRESKSRNQKLHHHCISQDLLIKAHSPPFCHLVLFNILTYSADLPMMPSPILSFSLVHCQLMTMIVYKSNLISAQSNVPTTQGGTVSALSGHQLLLPPPSYLCLPISSTAWLEVHTPIWGLTPPHTLHLSAQLNWFLADVPYAPCLG